MTNALTTLGERIRRHRRERGQTQEQAAASMGISRNYLSQIEIGRATNLTATMQQRITDYLNDTTMPNNAVGRFLVAVRSEYHRAVAAHPTPRASLHEAYAYALEEFDELWAEIKKPEALRNRAALRIEATHAAAMLVRLAVECGLMEEFP